jgi:hypothetical protein
VLTVKRIQFDINILLSKKITHKFPMPEDACKKRAKTKKEKNAQYNLYNIR